MVTVEAAIAMGGLVAVLAVVLGAIGAAVVQLRCVDAAGEVARRAARDDPAATREVLRGLPAGSEVSVTVEGEEVRVAVAAPPLGAALPGLRLSAEAVAAREPLVAAPVGVAEDTGPALPPESAEPAESTESMNPAESVDPAAPADPDSADLTAPADPGASADAGGSGAEAGSPPSVEELPP